MFNLIVSGKGWQPHRDCFGSGRVLEYTNATAAQPFMPNKVLDLNAVSKLPTLFMSETQGFGGQVTLEPSLNSDLLAMNIQSNMRLILPLIRSTGFRDDAFQPWP